MKTEEQTIMEKANSWVKSSVTLKLITITILMLLLLIPASMIENIIRERERLNSQATNEVSSKWAGEQLVLGPILSIPVTYTLENEKDGTTHHYNEFIHILPDQLAVSGKIEPQKLKRGIYEVVVYKSNLVIEGQFDLNQDIKKGARKEIHFNESFLTFGITDMRGIENQIAVEWDNANLPISPGSGVPDMIHSGIKVDIPEATDSAKTVHHFKCEIMLKGSQSLSFLPLGNTTEVNLTSSWADPAFNGSILPSHREVTDDGFKAFWKVLQVNRSFPQIWYDSDEFGRAERTAFGVDLKLPIDDYQKSMRSAKYAVMTIALTFLIFFLVEILSGPKIHPFQYALVGLALCLFYILLVSISEQSNFNLAYGISSVVITAMISLYATTIFKKSQLTIILVGVLTAIYGFVFVTLQLADFALLMGSIGLTIILSLTMYFTRNINWYKVKS